MESDLNLKLILSVLNYYKKREFYII